MVLSPHTEQGGSRSFLNPQQAPAEDEDISQAGGWRTMTEDQFWLIVLSYTVSGCLECDKGWTGEEAEWESI